MEYRTEASEGLELTKEDGVATITFNRPDKANAIGLDWPSRIVEFLREVEHDSEARCVLLRGRGKHFQAGGDLDAQPKFDENDHTEKLAWIGEQITIWNAMIRAIMNLPKPVVASIQGGTVGASLGLLGAVDLVIAADDAFLWLAQPKYGFPLDGMPSYFLPRLMGTRRAMEWALLGRRISMGEAKEFGLVNFIVPRDELEAETDRLMRELAEGPTVIHGINKKLINASLGNSYQEQAAAELENYLVGAVTQDWNEGRASFSEKRKPVFKGR